MKALTRRLGEVVTETDGITGIDWKTGAPMTNEAWCGGPYTLVQNYIPQDAPESYDEIVVEPEQIEVEDEDEYVIIDGKKYSKEELRSLLE